jgi:hypothetical protein
LLKTRGPRQGVAPTYLSLSSRSKSSSKSERDLDCVVPQIGLSPIRLVLIHHEWKSRQKRTSFQFAGLDREAKLVEVVDELVEAAALS